MGSLCSIVSWSPLVSKVLIRSIMRLLVILLVVSFTIAAAKKGKGKGKKPSKCPKPAEIMEYAAEKFAGEICFLQELGWLDSDMNSDDAKILGDINTLPNEISKALTGT